jgi:Predicted transcription factor, homolog of eukaryotic MBF1
MGEVGGWAAMRERRMAEPGAKEAYEATRLAFELGRAVRELRERRGWSQKQLAKASGMTQSAVARFEAGGTVLRLAVLERLATALGVRLTVGFEPPDPAARRVQTRDERDETTQLSILTTSAGRRASPPS